MNFLVINGPNLNLLGLREPELYGHETYQDLCAKINDWATAQSIKVEIMQSNYEGDLVEAIQKAYPQTQGIVINAAAYTHTSIAILDALKAVQIPTVEVHISALEHREPFRQIAYLREACIDTVSGHDLNGYIIALEKLKEHIKQ